MKGKKLIVIMAIVILMFTIQASCALENDNDFNLTQTTDVNTVNNQIVDDNVISNQVNDVKDELNDSADIKNRISVSSKSSVLGVSNENNVLGNSSNYKNMSDLRTILQNAQPGQNIFLNGSTYVGKFNPILIKNNINIYGGHNTTDGIKATLDLSEFQCSSQTSNTPRLQFKNICKITGVNFVNYNFTSDNIVPGAIIPERGNIITLRAPCSFYNCTFANNTIYQKSYVIEYSNNDNIGGSGATIENCVFYNNTASVIVCIQS
ncbi:hypothetical protein, partial [Methanobrevibacter sp. UBA188]|uniref:hypothetical protein n=1 Tax=Methanobrevibacter sp. UBA188 TaxID=1915473 RepID=UPI0025CF4D6B